MVEDMDLPVEGYCLEVSGLRLKDLMALNWNEVRANVQVLMTLPAGQVGQFGYIFYSVLIGLDSGWLG